jgi:nitroreductase
MPDRNPAALDFLLTRRSCPARLLAPPLPDEAQLQAILIAALRCPDHGKLEPWRLVVIERAALTRIAGEVAMRGLALELESDRIAKAVAQYAGGHLAVLVVAVPRPTDKVPAIEQTLSAGAVCLSLLNAALASGFGANWLTGWPLHDGPLLADSFGLAPGEWAAGIVHIGTATETPPDRPRPDLARAVTWMRA